MVENDHKELAIILQGSVMMDEVQVVERKIGVVKSRSSVLNQDMISSAELARAACCNLGESFTTNPSVDVSYADAATGARQIKLLGLSGTYVQMLTENIPNYRGASAPFALGYIPGPWMQSIKISLILLFTASKKIDIQGLGSLRLLKFNIYLSGNRLITILYR